MSETVVPAAPAQRLVAMLNQIALNFRTLPEEQAVAAIAEHVRQFWDPRMRRLILEHAAHGGEGVNALARKALDKLLMRG